jgi:two-component system, sensor histidine kinase and response regulator
MNRILVIDDDPNVREAVVEVLQSRGYQTLAAAGADAGKSLAVSQAPDLVISDIMMPGKDGYTLLSEFREDSATAAIPFILMTGVDNRDRYRAGMDLGADDYLAKPFTGEQLDKAIKACLKKNSLVVSRADEKVANLLNILENTLPHELRTPLNGILGFSEMLKTCPEKFSEDEIVQAAECINTSAKRLHRLVENLLMSARVRVMQENSGALEGTNQKSGFEFVPLVDCLAKDYDEQYDREADLETAAEGDITCSDPQVACKALEEIIDNAFKFSEVGTRVCVAIRNVDGKTQISVEDHGRGMEAEHVARIDVFRQFDRSHFEQQGAGLGLFIAKQVVFEFGGGFEVSSVPGAGTKITVTLPVVAGLHEEERLEPCGLRKIAV